MGIGKEPEFYVSTITGKKYPYQDWANFGTNPGGQVKIKGKVYNDLPKEEYPYTLEYKK